MNTLTLNPDLSDVGEEAMTDQIDSTQTKPAEQEPAAPAPWRYSAWSIPPAAQRFLRGASLSVIGILLFMLLWQATANSIDTSLGKFPGPIQVIAQAQNMVEEYDREQQRRVDFFARQQVRNDELLRNDPSAEVPLHRQANLPESDRH